MRPAKFLAAAWSRKRKDPEEYAIFGLLFWRDTGSFDGVKSSVLDLRGGVISLWDLDFVNVERPFSEQREHMKEDLVQLAFHDLILDVGWYPESSFEGRMVILVVKDYDWEDPLWRQEVDESSAFVRALTCAIEFAASNHRYARN